MEDGKAHAEVGVGKCRFETLDEAVASFLVELAELSRRLASGPVCAEDAPSSVAVVGRANSEVRPAVANTGVDQPP
jgi:hypothetical protein